MMRVTMSRRSSSSHQGVRAGVSSGALSPASRRMAGKARRRGAGGVRRSRSEEHTSELQSLMRISYAVFCLKKKKNTQQQQEEYRHNILCSHLTAYEIIVSENSTKL